MPTGQCTVTGQINGSLSHQYLRPFRPPESRTDVLAIAALCNSPAVCRRDRSGRSPGHNSLAPDTRPISIGRRTQGARKSLYVRRAIGGELKANLHTHIAGQHLEPAEAPNRTGKRSVCLVRKGPPPLEMSRALFRFTVFVFKLFLDFLDTFLILRVLYFSC